MNLKNFKITNRGLYWGLISTFLILYVCVGFVSTLHSITFFQLANNLGLAILLGLTYEVGQASVLFSILMTKNKEKFLPWALMFLLTALQVTANVYASFKFMVNSGNTDYTYWQKSILFGVQASSPEMYQVIISWIAGALLPIVALGMTTLVAQNIKLMTDENIGDKLPAETVKDEPELEKIEVPALIAEPSRAKSVGKILDEENGLHPGIWDSDPALKNGLPTREEQLTSFKNAIVNNMGGKASDIENKPLIGEGRTRVIKPPIIIQLGPETQEEANSEYAKSLDKNMHLGEGGIQVLKDAHAYDAVGTKEAIDVKPEELSGYGMEGMDEIQTGEKKAIDAVSELSEDIIVSKVKPVNKIQGWHFMKEFVDNDRNVFQRGTFVKNDPEKTPTELKKA